MNINEITKVTVWNVTARINAVGKIEADDLKDRWCVAAFTKSGAMPLSAALIGEAGDKEIKPFLVVTTRNRATVLAHEFAAKFPTVKESSTVTQGLESAKKAVEEEDAKRKAAADERKACPERAATKALRKAVEKAEKVAAKSTNVTFKQNISNIAVTVVKMDEAFDAAWAAVQAQQNAAAAAKVA